MAALATAERDSRQRFALRRPGRSCCSAASSSCRRSTSSGSVLQPVDLRHRRRRFVGLANYAKVLGDPYFWRALLNTVIVVVVVVHVELLLGLGMALLFAARLPLRALMLVAAVLAPYAVSEVGGGGDVALPVRPDVGHDEPAARRIGLPPIEWSVKPTHGLAWSALLSIWLHLPFTFVILYAARLAIPSELYEAAAHRRRHRLAGLPPRSRLPLLMPAMLIAMLFRYIFAFRLFSEVWLMTRAARRARPRWSPSISISRPSATTLSAPPPRPAGSGRSPRSCSRCSICAGSTGRCSRNADERSVPMLRGIAEGRRRRSSIVLAWSIVPDRADRDVVASRPTATSSRRRRASSLRADARELSCMLWSRWGDFFTGLWNSFIVTIGATAARRRRLDACRLRLFALSPARRCQARAFFLIFLRLIPPIVITLPLFPIVNWLGLNDTHLDPDPALRDLLRVARHDGDAHLHRPDPARARRGRDDRRRLAARRSSRRVILPARGAGHARGRGLRHRLCLERIPLRLHLHDHGTPRPRRW